jgi:hypothetical protein
MQDKKEIPTAKYMFSMMPESMERNAVCCENVIHCATPKFKMVENQSGSTYSLLCTKYRNKIRKRYSNRHIKDNLLYIVTGEHYFAV